LIDFMGESGNHLAERAESTDVSYFRESSAFVVLSGSPLRNIDERANCSARSAIGVEQRRRILEQTNYPPIIMDDVDLKVADFQALAGSDLHRQLVIGNCLPLEINADEVGGASVAIRRFGGILRFIETENSREPAIYTNVFALGVYRDANANGNHVEEGFKFTGAVMKRSLQARNFGFQGLDSLAVWVAGRRFGRRVGRLRGATFKT
jgi:hypothetical protein